MEDVEGGAVAAVEVAEIEAAGVDARLVDGAVEGAMGSADAVLAGDVAALATGELTELSAALFAEMMAVAMFLSFAMNGVSTMDWMSLS